MLGNVMILVGLSLLRALRVSTLGQQQLLSSRAPAASIGRKRTLRSLAKCKNDSLLSAISGRWCD